MIWCFMAPRGLNWSFRQGLIQPPMPYFLGKGQPYPQEGLHPCEGPSVPSLPCIQTALAHCCSHAPPVTQLTVTAQPAQACG